MCFGTCPSLTVIRELGMALYWAGGDEDERKHKGTAYAKKGT
jgi:hypothetical protein